MAKVLNFCIESTTVHYYGIYKSEALTLKNFKANFKDYWRLDPKFEEFTD